MSISCTYPDRGSDEFALCSDMLSEQLSHFDLAYQYTVLLEEEVTLFFATVFKLAPSSSLYKEMFIKGKAVRSGNSIVYCLNDIPVVEIRATSDPYGEYSFEMECYRLYAPVDAKCF